MENLKLKHADIGDVKQLCSFTDYWLAGRGKRFQAPGATNDCFISPSQHKKYILKYKTYIVLDQTEIVAWAVIQNDGSLIHFLISGFYRHQGIGTRLLRQLAPKYIRSKSNQSSGDPAAFYGKNGYKLIMSVRSKSRLDIEKIRPDREKIIDIFKKTNKEVPCPRIKCTS